MIFFFFFSDLLVRYCLYFLTIIDHFCLSHSWFNVVVCLFVVLCTLGFFVFLLKNKINKKNFKSCTQHIAGEDFKNKPHVLFVILPYSGFNLSKI